MTRSEEGRPSQMLGLRRVGGENATAPALSPYYEDDLVTLYNGDCLELLPALLGDVPALRFGAVVTDPPYGIKWRRGENRARQSPAHHGIVNDEDTSVRDAALALTAALPAYVFGSFYAPYPADLKQVLVWPKPPDSGVVGAVTGHRRDAEPVFVVGPWPIRSVEWSSVLPSGAGGITAVTTAAGHPHAKPVPLLRELIRRCPVGTILDPFTGSGSTLRAAKDMGRKAVGIEIDTAYCETAAKFLAQDVLFGEAAA